MFWWGQEDSQGCFGRPLPPDAFADAFDGCFGESPVEEESQGCFGGQEPEQGLAAVASEGSDGEDTEGCFGSRTQASILVASSQHWADCFF